MSAELKGRIDQFPHCDQRVLHAPGECEYCDLHPEWQALRISWGISFTGHDDGDLVCPATVRRDVETIHRWSGNQPDNYSGPTITHPLS